MFFGKKITIFKKKDKSKWLEIKTLLKSNGFNINASHYSADSLCACGCGSKLDPRNFGAKGYIDRDIYYIDVKEKDSQRVYEILAANNLKPEIDEDPVGKLGRMI